MPVSALVGLQWGDEGKGKIVDILAERADVVVRCQGGANAGHTVVVGGKVYALHLIPSGILRQGVICLVGNGVVSDPVQLLGELRGIEKLVGSCQDRFFISDRSHMVLPWHKELDGLAEERLGRSLIGTTRQGIGPAYIDKVRRSGLRWHHTRDRREFKRRFQASLLDANGVIAALGGKPLQERETLDTVLAAVEEMRGYVADSVSLLHRFLREGKRILLEGAQGTMLDVDFGTYPFVTSSNSSSGGCVTGSGLPPTSFDTVHGLLKSYTTRVGSGPFPTEVDEDTAIRFRGKGDQQWDEFGTTTGRPRRCGWLDLVVARHAVRVNGAGKIHLTKLDILSQFDNLKVATAYRIRGRNTSDFPSDIADLEKAEPVYKTLPGWLKPLPACQNILELPAEARNYVDFIAEFLETEVASVSYGPEREQTAFGQ
ncbi:MAG: adenylosuccinate synthase [Planctomycetota bacterium]|jgi:adenylosuccinate synthase|nr:adenylosuccinate synthase [Planctomycetota bacterium]